MSMEPNNHDDPQIRGQESAKEPPKSVLTKTISASGHEDGMLRLPAGTRMGC